MRKHVLLYLFWFVSIADLARAQSEVRPNIVFVYVDDMGWRDLSFNGSRYYETPVIDNLASEGVWFPQAYSVGPNCAPSRASLMTGLYTPRHGIYTVGTAERGDASKRKLVPVANKTTLDPGFTTIAEELKKAGYVTSLIGKWQLGNDRDKADAGAQGFDHVVGGSPGTASYFFPYFKNEKGLKSPHIGLEQGGEDEYLTDRLTDEAMAFIAANTQHPFFLYLSYFAVHTPIQGKNALVEKYKRKKGDDLHHDPEYAAMIESVDENVGRLLRSIDASGLSDNTVVIFYSDNGGMGEVTSQLPLRGSKGMLYEGGVRVPLIVRWPGKIHPGVCEEPVIGVDFYPTLLELAKVRSPLNASVDGQSFAPLLFGKEAKSRDLFWHFPAYLEAYKGDARNSGPFRTRPVSVIRSGDFKLLEFYEEGRKELYNLAEDIGETNSLADRNPEKVRELSQKLAEWRLKTNAFEPKVRNEGYRAD